MIIAENLAYPLFCIFHCYILFIFSKLPFSPVSCIISHQSMSSTVVLHSLHVLQVTILSSALRYFSSVHVLLCYTLFMFSELPFTPVASICFPSVCIFHYYTLFMFSKLPFSPVAFIISHQSMSSTVTFFSCSANYHSLQWLPGYHCLQWLSLSPIGPWLPLLHSLHVLEVAIRSSGFHSFPSVLVLHCYTPFMFPKLPFFPCLLLLLFFLWVSTVSVTPLLILQCCPLYIHVCCTVSSCVTPLPMASCFYPSVHQLHVFHSDSVCPLLSTSFPVCGLSFHPFLHGFGCYTLCHPL